MVIASVGRDTLMQAVESCLNQTRPPLEVVLVFDLSEVPETFDAPAGVRVLCTGKTMGVNAARDLGIQSARGQAIALLDDDDYWYPEKLSAQVALMQEIHRQGMRAVVATGLDYIVDGEVVYSGPKRVIHPGQRVADYLFKRRQARDGGAGLHTSSLLIDIELLTEVPLDTRIDLHEDWDWLLRAERQPRVRIAQVPEPLSAYRLPSPGSPISRSQQWPDSVAWIDSWETELTSREYGDFLLSVSVPLAIDAGNRSSAVKLIFKALRHARPGLPALTMGTGLLLLPHQGSRALWPHLERLETWKERSASAVKTLLP